MSVGLYSSGSTDALLAAKLSDAPIDGSTYGRLDGAWAVVAGGGGLTVNDLSNGATSTLNATVPTTGQALTYDGTDLVWATVSAPVTSVAGRTGAITLANTDISGLGTMAVVNDAPSDSKAYVRKDAAWLALVSDIPDFAWYDHPNTAYSTVVVNGGVAATSVYATNIHNLVTSASLANSRASMATSKSTSVSGYVGQFYGNAALAKYRLNWSKKIALHSAFNDGGNGINANVNYYVGIGLPYPANFVGVLTDKGMGIHINTTAANTAQIRILYHDGTTAKASDYVNYNSLQANNNFANNSWTLYSDGNGTIKLFCYSNLQNGLAITVTDGPTGVGSTNNNTNIGASILTGATASGNTICQLMPRVYYGL